MHRTSPHDTGSDPLPPVAEIRHPENRTQLYGLYGNEKTRGPKFMQR